MKESKVTLQEFQKKIRGIHAGIDMEKGETIHHAMNQLSEYLAENVDDFDAEARALCDEMLEKLTSGIQEQISSLPTTRHTRRLKRKARNVTSNFTSGALMASLSGNEKLREVPLLDDAKKLFEPQLQEILDILQDVGEHKQVGGAEFAITALFSSIVNELTVGFHLAQRAYPNQAYIHLRTVYENCDKIELFRKFPNMVSDWTDATKWQEFLPSKIRTKLGKPKRDPLYSKFSELGPHGSFEAMQLFIGKCDDANSPGGKQVRIWIGGTPREDHLIWSHLFLLSTTAYVIQLLTTIYESVLDRGASDDALIGSTLAVIAFQKSHLLRIAKEQGWNTARIESSIAAQTATCDKWVALRQAQETQSRI